MSVQTVLIPLDSSKHSEFCLEYYMKYIHREGNIVHACYVADNFGDVGVMDGPTPGRVHELEAKDQRHSCEVEDHFIDALKEHQNTGTFHRMRSRDVWHTIIECATSVNANLIVMGSRGLGKMRRTLLGSVSDSVVHHAHIPVLICKMPHDDHHGHKHDHHHSKHH